MLCLIKGFGVGDGWAAVRVYNVVVVFHNWRSSDGQTVCLFKRRPPYH